MPNIPPARPVVEAEEACRTADGWPAGGALATARSLYRERQKRAAFFDTALFGEAAWDILLDLYVAAVESRAVSVSDCCISAHVPQSTGLRYIAALEENGSLVRNPDPQDGRRVFVSLTADAFAAMDGYLRAISAPAADR